MSAVKFHWVSDGCLGVHWVHPVDTETVWLSAGTVLVSASSQTPRASQWTPADIQRTYVRCVRCVSTVYLHFFGHSSGHLDCLAVRWDCLGVRWFPDTQGTPSGHPADSQQTTADTQRTYVCWVSADSVGVRWESTVYFHFWTPRGHQRSKWVVSQPSLYLLILTLEIVVPYWYLGLSRGGYSFLDRLSPIIPYIFFRLFGFFFGFYFLINALILSYKVIIMFFFVFFHIFFYNIFNERLHHP